MEGGMYKSLAATTLPAHQCKRDGYTTEKIYNTQTLIKYME